nr:fimbrial protein [uncultured Moellerella sp.]
MNLYKKVALSVLITGATTGYAFAAGEQGQGSGKVVFHGYIIDAPCSIVSDNPINVEFGQISKKTLSANNNTGESHIRPFEIELADCSFEEGVGADGKPNGEYVGNQVAVTFTYSDAVKPGSAEGSIEVVDMVAFDGKDNMGAGVVIVSGNTRVENNKPLPVQKIQVGPNTLGFSSYVKGIGIPDVMSEDGKAVAKSGINTGEFYATANFSLAYQ